jgi:aminoglycoside phosphotransferase family enzyme/predicted kinase
LKGGEIMLSTETTPKTSEILQLLRDPRTYGERTQSVELVETHISWVFLTDQFAYKLKKPVRFEFLDFSTPQARELACAEEIRLNRRLTHHVYLSMLPITADASGKLELNGDGHPVEYVVKMRRLPSEIALDKLIRQRMLGPSQANELVDYLLNFYTQLPPKIVRPEEYYQDLVEHCRGNRDDLLEFANSDYHLAINRIHSAQLQFLWLAKERFLNRVRDGRIIDGHGDLRAEHVFLESPPAVIDCIEFSEELRQVDVADDLGCLAMDCARLGDHEVGNRLLSTYETLSGDQPLAEIYDFYKSYRACVRAKVAALYLQQPNVAQRKLRVRELHHYLQWADHHAARLGRPLIIVIGGLTGTGKSALASALAGCTATEVISTDRIRHTLFGTSKSPAKYESGHYRPELRRQVYQELFNQAREYLDNGQSVALDGTFLTNDLRLRAIELGKQHGAIPVFVECECSREIALARIADRAESGKGLSEARPECFDRQAVEREDPCPSLHCIRVDTTNSIIETMNTLAEKLRRFDGVKS